jgi:recombination protein RecA
MAKKKVSDLTPSQKDALSDLLNSDGFKDVAKKLGSDILFRASQEPPVKFIPTAVFPWDWATNGGFPIGRATTLYGPKSSSKTSMALRGIAQAQQMCAHCWTYKFDPLTGEEGCACKEYREPMAAFVNAEQSWDPDWATALGVDAEKVLVSKPEFGEAATDVGEYLLRSGKVDILLLDSLATLVPSKEIEEEAGKSLVGEQARLIHKLVRKWLASQRACEREHGFKPTIIFINQIRYKIGVMFGSPETVPGGEGPGFLSSLEVRTRSEGGTKAGVKKDDTSDTESIKMAFKVTKSKVGPAFREGDYRLIVKNTEYKKKGDVADEDSVFRFGNQEGLITKKGNGWQVLGEHNFRSKEKFFERLLTDTQFSWELRTRLLKQLLES